MLSHRSPGLSQVLTEIEKLDKPHILDLGASCSGMLKFFADQKCKLYFEDLASHLFQHPDSIENKIDSYLLDYGETKFDVVLTWDLLNYLGLEAINRLMTKFNDHCRPDTLFHMIRYAKSSIPRQPRRFTLTAIDNVDFVDEEPVPRAVPIHSTVRLLQQMKDHYLEQTIMNEPGMREGFVEHLLRFQPTRDHRKIAINNTDRRTLDPESEENRQYHASPGLKAAFTHLKTLSQPKVLVAGSAKGSGLNVFARYTGDVYAENISDSIQWRQSQEAHGNTINHNLLNYPEGTKFDLVILWDLFNYCLPAEMQTFGKLLDKYTHDASQLLLVSYTNQDIPAQAQHFSLESEQLVSIVGSKQVRKKPINLTASLIMKLLPNFRVSKSYVFQEGMIPGLCEYVFQCVTGNASSQAEEKMEHETF